MNRIHRKVIHEVLQQCTLGPLRLAASHLDFMLRVYKGGFTPGEVRYLRKRLETLREVTKEIDHIYFRTKF